jgi:hypothetical protein
MSSVDKAPRKAFLSVQMIVLIEIIWAVLALLFFLLFSAGQERSFWYSLGTSIFEATAFLVASLLCFRNWQSSQIVSGRSVWLNIGLGMLFYFLGNLLFSYWELGLGLEPAVSPGDFFFILTYVFLLLGIAQAVLSRRLNLELWQKGVVVGIGIIGIVIAVALATSKPSDKTSFWLEAPAYAQTVEAQQSSIVPIEQRKVSATIVQAKPPAPAIPSSPSDKTPKPTAPPEWASNLETQLQPLEFPVNLFYLVCDVLLLVLATTLLLAFWGGRFAQSWRMIAAAAFCLYIADMWFKYATTTNPDYKSGSLPEVFWIFSAVLFGIGAALEYDLSSRSRRTGSRRRA